MSIPRFPSIAEFLFDAPLYAEFQLVKGQQEIEMIYGRREVRIDGHCPFCHKLSTFKVHGTHIPGGIQWDNIETRYAFEDDLKLECARHKHHVIYFKLRISNLCIQKIGQYPSLADIANDESKIYRSVLTAEDSAELHKAIGLAAHGVGIGSFVYLRRIFERLIIAHFERFKQHEGWDDAEFYPARMEDKIGLLKDHLPPFLVSNKRIYSILSIGIHELEEKQCLSFFEIMKQSIIFILEEDKRQKEEQELRDKFSKAIASFDASSKTV